MNSHARPRGSLKSRQESAQVTAPDNPVPSDSCIATAESERCPGHPHDVEAEVQRMLLGAPHLDFTSLVVRRVPQGVCLEGMLHSTASSGDVAELARMVAGVDVVINHLLVCTAR